MKLLDVQDNTLVITLEECEGPPGTTPVPKGETIYFKHIDGMYSCCLWDSKIVHLKAWAEVGILK